MSTTYKKGDLKRQKNDELYDIEKQTVLDSELKMKQRQNLLT